MQAHDLAASDASFARLGDGPLRSVNELRNSKASFTAISATSAAKVKRNSAGLDNLLQNLRDVGNDLQSVEIESSY